MLRAEFHLPSITAEEATPERKAPIRVKFEIPYFTVSGIQVSCDILGISYVSLYSLSETLKLKNPNACVQVRYLKIIEKSGYQALPWVRYITMAGEYELRLM